jgi:hypothetical protein
MKTLPQGAVQGKFASVYLALICLVKATPQLLQEMKGKLD